MLKKLIPFLIIFLIIFGLTGCSNNNKSEEELLKEKVLQELEYLDTNIISMLNRLNNINFENYEITSKEVQIDKNESNSSTQEPNSESEDSSSKINVTKMEPNTILAQDTNNIDWVTLKNEIELLNSSWSIVILDLYSLKLDNEQILLFSTALDKCVISIKDENKRDSLVNLAELYSFIPIYLSGIPEESSKADVKQTKAYIVNSYALVEQQAWTEITANIQKADNMFKTIMADIEYTKTREYKTNQTYVLLKELEQSVGAKDQKLFYIKYKNVMESINIL